MADRRQVLRRGAVAPALTAAVASPALAHDQRHGKASLVIGHRGTAYGRGIDEQITFLTAGLDGLCTDRADIGVLARTLRG